MNLPSAVPIIAEDSVCLTYTNIRIAIKQKLLLIIKSNVE